MEIAAGQSRTEETGPPAFLRLAAHPLRWSLLKELARSDRQVAELTELLGQPQNLVSYHLGRLRSEEMVSLRRSSQDGRRAYYRANLDRCAELLAASGRSLHPGLDLSAADGTPVAPPSHRAPRVLFLCTGNSARSQIAEALLDHLSKGRIAAASAGDQPRGVHANAIRAMAARGIDIRGRRSKHLDEFTGQRFDCVVTLCDHVRERCPDFPGEPDVLHWSIADPVSAGLADDETYAAFELAARDLAARIGYLLRLLER